MISTGFFCQHLPWNFITKFHEGVVVQKDGILQRTFAYRAPDIDSSDAMSVHSLSLRVNDVAKRLGSGWAFTLEAQRFYTQEYPASQFEILAPYLIDKEREAAFRAAGNHFESSYYLTFIYRPPSEGAKKLISLFVQSGTGGEGAGIKQNVDYFVNETNAIAAVLSNDLLLAPLDNEQTVKYLHSTVSFNRHPIRFPCTQILLDRILPDSELVTSLTMKLGEYYMPIIGVNDFPDETYPAILDDLNRAKLEYRWVSRYICLDKEEGTKESRKKEKSHRGNRKTFLQTLGEATSGEATQTVNHGAGVKESDSIAAGVEIETDQAALGYLSTNVCVWDKSLIAANKKAELVKSIITSSGFPCKEERFNAFESFKSMMPGQVYANYRALPVMTYNLSHVVPLSSVWAGLRWNKHAEEVTGVGDPHVVCSTAEGTPFSFNMNPASDVGHTSVLGPTGAGKSTFLNLLEMQFFKYPGSQVIVFDKGRSCRQPCLAVGGLFYEPAGESIAGVSFQPLRDLKSDRELLDAMDFIESCITANNYEVTPPMRVAIKESLELLRGKPKEARTISGFVHYANYLDPETKRPVFAELLADYMWKGGKYGKIFDARGSAISLDTRFLAIEMEALMQQGPGCVIPALVYLFNLVEKKFDGRLSLLVLDEAWLFLKNPIFADKIAEWLKVLRKKNVFVVFATQDVADVYSSPLRTTIIQQCLTKIYLADPSATTAAMLPVYRAFGLSDSEIGLISAATMKRDYFYTSPLGRRLFQLDLGPLTLSLIGQTDHALLDNLLVEYDPGTPLCGPILSRKRVDIASFLGPDAPEPVELVKRTRTTSSITPEPRSIPDPFPEEDPVPADQSLAPADPGPGLFDAIRAMSARKQKDGGGRAAMAIAKQFSVSEATVYQARKVLKQGDDALIEAMTRGEIPIKTAYKKLKA